MRSRDRLSRDFLGCPIFDFCDDIGTKRTKGRCGPEADVGVFGRIFGLGGRGNYRELRVELLCCPAA